MLTAIEVASVRIFAAKARKFELQPLTVLCGTNSAGKSTVAKIPLLLRQSQGIGEPLPAMPGQLRLVGSQVDFGTFQSFVHGNDTSEDVTIGLGVEALMPKSAVTALKLWKAQGSKTGFAPPTTTEEMVPYTLRVRFNFGLRRHPGRQGRSRTSTRQSTSIQVEPVGPAMLKRASFEVSIGSDKLLEWQLALVPDPVHGLLGPPRYQLVVPGVLLRAVGWSDHMEIREDPETGYATFPTNLAGILPSGLMVRMRAAQPGIRAGRKQETQYSVWPLPFVIGGAIQDLQQALRGIHYLGPLRAPAKRYYVAQASVDPGMDASGEFLPYVLRDRAHDLVQYCPPGVMEPTSEPLALALDKWLRYLRTGSHVPDGEENYEIAVAATKDVLIEFSLRSAVGADSHALADSGFGYSQVLPILVRGLLAEPGSTLIVEQPELHLNPALQVRLSEFFVGLAEARKQVILETHSEHIVNAMRVLAAETGHHLSRCGVYFLDASDGAPVVHQLSIGDDGTMDRWPRNFFGESASLRARLLRAQRRFIEAPEGP